MEPVCNKVSLLICSQWSAPRYIFWCAVPDIHSFSIPALSYSVLQGVGAYPSCHQAGGRVHPGQDASPSQSQRRDKQPCTLTITPSANLESVITINMHIFRPWEEAGVPGWSLDMLGENMQTPHRRTLAKIWTRNRPATRRQREQPLKFTSHSWCLLHIF